MPSEIRYFIEIELDTLQVVRLGSDFRDQLEGGRQTQAGIHRLFISKGQFNKFVERCGPELSHVLDN